MPSCAAISCRLVFCTPFCANSSRAVSRMRCLVSEGRGTSPSLTYFPIGKQMSYAYLPEGKEAPMRILISGASIAGPVLAYWLHRYGFDVTVVERAPRLRKTGGHPVDLFRPGMDISEKKGGLPAT